MKGAKMLKSATPATAPKSGKGKLLERFLGASPEEIRVIYERTVLSTLRPRLVLGLACAQNRTIILLADGNIYEFPRNGLPRPLDLPKRAVGQVLKIAAGKHHFVALTNHMAWNVYTWGTSEATSDLLGRTISRDQPELAQSFPSVVEHLPGRVSYESYQLKLNHRDRLILGNQPLSTDCRCYFRSLFHNLQKCYRRFLGVWLL